jgi:hypothetical protein
MGDAFRTIVDHSASPQGAPALAKKVIHYLIPD